MASVAPVRRSAGVRRLIDGAVVENDFDLIAAFGNEVGGMLEYLVVSDGDVDVSFCNVVENPLLNGSRSSMAASSPGSLGARGRWMSLGITLLAAVTEIVTLSNLGFEVGDPRSRSRRVDVRRR